MDKSIPVMEVSKGQKKDNDICLYCGKKIISNPVKITNSRQGGRFSRYHIFCSNKCFGEWGFSGAPEGSLEEMLYQELTKPPKPITKKYRKFYLGQIVELKDKVAEKDMLQDELFVITAIYKKNNKWFIQLKPISDVDIRYEYPTNCLQIPEEHSNVVSLTKP